VAAAPAAIPAAPSAAPPQRLRYRPPRGSSRHL
jgi:hypothetical protein